MLNEFEIRELGTRFNVPTGVIEKDYVITKFLYNLRHLKGKLIFKGGTALKKIYLQDMRFSEDLDFTAQKLDFKPIIEKIIKKMDIQMEIKEISKFQLSRSYVISFVGPLNYKNSFSLDFSFRENPELKPIDKTIIHFYPDIPSFSFTTFKLEEIIAEKLRASYTRGAARDLLDIYFLLRKDFNTRTVKRLFKKKLESVEVNKISKQIFYEKVSNFQIPEIRYLVPANLRLNKEEIIKRILKAYAFLFRQ